MNQRGKDATGVGGIIWRRVWDTRLGEMVKGKTDKTHLEERDFFRTGS